MTTGGYLPPPPPPPPPPPNQRKITATISSTVKPTETQPNHQLHQPSVSQPNKRQIMASTDTLDIGSTIHLKQSKPGFVKRMKKFFSGSKKKKKKDRRLEVD